MNSEIQSLVELRRVWQAKWPEALAIWSKYTQLKSPRWCLTAEQEATESLTDSFAMIRFDDQAVVISLRQIVARHLEAYALEIMAHEIGHHVFCPADLSDRARMLARIRRALPTKEHLAGFVSNLWADLLINDRLQRGAGLRMEQIYRAIVDESQDRMWTFYMRIFEVLWGLPKASLATGKMDAIMEADAFLAAKLVRSFAKDWLKGAGAFAALCFSYLVIDEGQGLQALLKPMWDLKEVGETGFPVGLAEEEEDEDESEILLDRQGSDPLPNHVKPPKKRRDLREYGEILRALGVNLAPNAIAKKYYKELAVPHLIPFPESISVHTTEPLPEGLDPWDVGESIDSVDWLESQMQSPRLIPGYTTVQRHYGASSGAESKHRPLNLYLGIDCSGSMPNPQLQLSFPVLAGTILALSALRAGAKVKIVLSGEPGYSQSTRGFIAEEDELLTVLTSYLGTGQFFEMHRLRETFLIDGADLPSSHIIVISDIDVFISLQSIHQGESGWSVAERARERAGGGAGYILHMPESYDPDGVMQMRKEHWEVFPVVDLETMIDFARQFSHARYRSSDGA